MVKMDLPQIETGHKKWLFKGEGSGDRDEHKTLL